MISMPYALLLAAPLTFFIAGEDDPAPAADNVVRVYDVSNLSMSWMEDEEVNTWLMPSVGPNFDEAWESQEPEMHGVDTFVDMILSLYEAEFEYEGRRVNLGMHGQMVVRGPEGLHDRVGSMITFLESVVNAEALLAVDTVVLTGPGPGGAVIDQAEAEAWLAGLPEAADHSQHVLRLRTDRESRLNLGSIQNAVIDFDVEIAQGAAIQDPIVVPVQTGTRLRMMGAPAENGLFVTYILEHSDRLSTAPLPVDLRFWSGSEKGGLTWQQDSKRLDDLRVMTRSQCASAFLPAGKALVLTHELKVSGGTQREVTILRQVGGGLPTRHELPLSREGTKLIFADLGAITPPTLWFNGTVFSRALGWMDGRFNYEPVLRAGLADGDQDMAMDLIVGDGQDYSNVDQFGRFLISSPHGSFMGEDAPKVATEQDEVIAGFDAMLIPGAVLDVEVVVSNGGATPVRARLAMRPGSAAAVVLGVQSVEIRDYDVEVAQFSAVPDLQMESVLDGMCLWLQLTPDRTGGLVLSARGGAQLRTSEQSLNFGGPIMDYVHQTASDKLMLSERTVLHREGDAWATTFGDSSGEGLSLTITVRQP